MECFKPEDADIDSNEDWEAAWDFASVGESVTDRQQNNVSNRYQGPIQKTSPIIHTDNIVKTSRNGSLSTDPTERHMPESAGKDKLVTESSKKETFVSRMALNDNKAGMEGLDKDKINAIIYEASKGSKYFENEKRKEEQMKKRIKHQQDIVDNLTKAQIDNGCREADKMLLEIEASRDLSRSIVHMDMDMFYAAVEMRDEPSLHDKPMAVGGTSMLSTSNYVARRYGVRAAMPGFIARKLCPDLIIVPLSFDKYTAVSREIRSILAEYDPNFAPMSLDEAYLDFTPHLTLRQHTSVDQRTYPQVVSWRDDCSCSLSTRKQQEQQQQQQQQEHSNNRRDIESSLDTHGPLSQEKGQLLEAKDGYISVDVMTQEADSCVVDNDAELSDVSKESPATMPAVPVCGVCGKQLRQPVCWQQFATDVEKAVREMRFRIQQKTGLTASAGIAPNTMVAKVCSDRNKPNGQYRVPPTVEAVKDFMEDLPIRKVCGIGRVSASLLEALGMRVCGDLVGRRRGLLYHTHSEGAVAHYMAVGAGAGSTEVSAGGDRKSISVERTFSEISAPDDLYKRCRELTESLVSDLHDEHIVGKTVTLKIKTVTFDVFTRAHSLPNATDDLDEIYTTARDLLKTEIQQAPGARLRLRLMGVRMSNLLGKDQVEKQKQTTITGMFSKINSKKQKQNIQKPEEFQTAKDIASLVSTSPSEHANTSDRCFADETLYVCPVCSEDIKCAGLAEFNQHLDTCVIISPNPKGSQQSCGDREMHSDGELFSESEDSNEIVRNVTKASKYDEESSKQFASVEQDKSVSSVSPVKQQTIVEYLHRSPIKSALHDSKCEPSESFNPTYNSENELIKYSKQLDDSVVTEETTSLHEQRAGTSCSPPIIPASDDELICPVCNQPQRCVSMEMFNRHLDSCLNQMTVKSLLAQDTAVARKRMSGENVHVQSQKRRKTDKNVQPIQSFFKRHS